MSQKKNFSYIQLFTILMVIIAIVFISAPVILHIIYKIDNNTRVEVANNVLDCAHQFYVDSLKDHEIVYPSEGLEFICNGKTCTSTIGVVSNEDGVAMLTSEHLVTYTLNMDDSVPSSGSLIITSEGMIIPKNIAIDSHICTYDNSQKKFLKC